MYTVEKVKLLNTMIDDINRRKRNRESFVATYRDVPILNDIHQLLEDGFSEDEETLQIYYYCNRFLSEQYTSMGRFSVSAEYNYKALVAATILMKKFQKKLDYIEELIIALLRDRNFYVDDDCKDVLELLKDCPLLEEERLTQIYNQRMNRRRNLKTDPVEMSKEYLDVIDEVEEQIERNRTTSGMGSCFEIWDLKETYLLEKGIRWSSPAHLNPRVRFD